MAELCSALAVAEFRSAWTVAELRPAWIVAELRSAWTAAINPGFEPEPGPEPGLWARGPLAWEPTGQNGFATVMVSDSLTVAM